MHVVFKGAALIAVPLGKAARGQPGKSGANKAINPDSGSRSIDGPDVAVPCTAIQI
jgi:hypothetical protein